MLNTNDGLQRILNSPESMAKIAEIAKTLQGTNSEDREQTQVPADSFASGTEALPLSPEAMQVLSTAISGYMASDRRTGLLEALRPFAHGKNQAVVEQALRAVRLAKTARALLQDREGGDHLVCGHSR